MAAYVSVETSLAISLSETGCDTRLFCYEPMQASCRRRTRSEPKMSRTTSLEILYIMREYPYAIEMEMCFPYVSRVGYCVGRRATKHPVRTGNVERPLRGSSRPPSHPGPIRGTPRSCRPVLPPDHSPRRTVTRGPPCPRPGGAPHQVHMWADRPLKIINYVRGRQWRRILTHPASGDRNLPLTIPELTFAKTSLAHDRLPQPQNRLPATGRRPRDPTHKYSNTSSLNKQAKQC